MTERRYNEKEVAAIFRAAAEGSQSPARTESGEEGLTLSELQAIGREVGMAPDAVAQAAHALGARPPASTQSLLGLPIGVQRSIALGRRLSDAEWELLVVELREVFNARGVVTSHGSLREWRNGNLQALLEPTPEGHRLRLKTVKGDARFSILGGLGALAAAVVVAIGAAAEASLSNDAGTIVLLAAAGLALLANGALRLPGWARLRARQMEGIAARLAHGVLPPPEERK